jgi:hypothetical protein
MIKSLKLFDVWTKIILKWFHRHLSTYCFSFPPWITLNHKVKVSFCSIFQQEKKLRNCKNPATANLKAASGHQGISYTECLPTSKYWWSNYQALEIIIIQGLKQNAPYVDLLNNRQNPSSSIPIANSTESHSPT